MSVVFSQRCLRTCCVRGDRPQLYRYNPRAGAGSCETRCAASLRASADVKSGCRALHQRNRLGGEPRYRSGSCSKSWLGGVFCGGGLKFCLLKRLRGFGIKKRGRNSLTVARSVRVASQSQSMGVASPIFQSGSQCTHYALPVREHGVFALGLVHEHNGDPYQHVFRVQPATQRPVTCTATQRTTPPV